GDVGSRGESGRKMTNKYFLCPTMQGPFAFDVRNGAYGYNYQYLGNSRTDNDGARYDQFPVGSSSMRAASQTVVFADSRGAGRKHGKHAYTLDPPRLAVEKKAVRFGPGADDVSAGLDASLYAYSPVEMRHGSRGTVAFVDSHAEPMRLTDLGYELNGSGVPLPIDPNTARTSAATNRLWNGRGREEIASEAR
ncbi:MAG: hypothetical protein ACYS7M_00825, partial [Planctomycetota bacterium]